MDLRQPQNVHCPYCGEPIMVLIDPDEVGQHYIEDCQVCCKPITFHIVADSLGALTARVHDENEPF